MALCQFCTKAAAPYTCPRCNKAFCGLACYRGTAHESCSEAFYEGCCRQALQREELSEDSRRAVLSMLQRQRAADEEEEGEEEGEEEEEEEEDSLAARMAGLDLDEDSEAIWERLTASERADFERQATSGALAPLVPIWRPWWLREAAACPPAVAAAMAQCPPLAQLLGRKAPHASVQLAALQALLTSAAVARRLNGEHLDSEAATEAAEMALELCPALEPTHALASEAEAVAEFAERLCSPPLLLLLLRDLLVLLQPCNGFQASQRTLAELSVVLRRGAKAARKRRGAEAEAEAKRLFLAGRKAQFWLSWTAACFGQLRAAVPALEAELCARTAEGKEQSAVRSAVERSGVRNAVQSAGERSGARGKEEKLIEELS